MREPVLTLKVSQQNHSEQGAKIQAILMTLFRSAELQGTNPVETLLFDAKSALTANTLRIHLKKSLFNFSKN